MHIKLLCLEKLKDKNLLAVEVEYLKRLRKFGKFETVEIVSRGGANLSAQERKRKDSELCREKIKGTDFLIALDEKGHSFSSEELATFLSKCAREGNSNLVFAIGGAYGWEPSFCESAKLTLSLSKMTFPYQLARIVLVEQLYRAFSIWRGVPYHKG